MVRRRNVVRRRRRAPNRRRSNIGRQRARTPRSTLGGAISTAVGSIAYNFVRRFVAGPVNTTTATPVPPWFSNLLTIPTLVMKALFAVLVRASDPVSGEPGSARPTDIPSARVGSAFCVGISTDDLMLSSPMVTDYEMSTTSPNRRYTTAFRQAKLEWLKVVISPSVDIMTRGGYIAAALVPFGSVDEVITHFSSKNGDLLFDAVANLTGAVVVPATRKFTLSLRPQPGTLASNWMETVHTHGRSTVWGGVGAMPFCRLHLCYQDFASTDATQASRKHTIEQITLDIAFESRIHLRDFNAAPGVGDTMDWMKQTPVLFYDPNSISVQDQSGRISRVISSEKTVIRDGILFLPPLDSPSDEEDQRMDEYEHVHIEKR